MTDEQAKLLLNFEARMKQLMLVCDKLRKENVKLSEELENERQKLKQAEYTITEITEKYNRLKLAGYMNATQLDIDKAGQRIDKLVREIDKCIALLNE